MSEISELERRLAAALDRMRQSQQAHRLSYQAALARVDELAAENTRLVEAAEAQPAVAEAAPAELEDLRRSLAERDSSLSSAQAVIDQLTQDLGQAREEIEALSTQAEEAAREAERSSAAQSIGKLEDLQDNSALQEMQGRVSELEQSLQQMQLANAQLRQNNAALRAAHAEGGANPELVQDGLQAELEALRAARAADRAEIESVLAALKPLVEETADA